MSHWQEWVVALVLLVCLVRIGKRLYATFHARKGGGTPCGCCPGSCHCHCGKPDEEDVESCCEQPDTKPCPSQADSQQTETAGKKHKCCCG